jgi:hypothetical protein
MENEASFIENGVSFIENAIANTEMRVENAENASPNFIHTHSNTEIAIAFSTN